MWPISPRVTFLVAGVALVCAVSGTLGYKLGRGEGHEEVRKMYEAGQKAVAGRQAEVTELRGKSREDADRIARLSRNARVRICPSPPYDGVPGDADADSSGDGGGTGKDITPILRQCLRSFGEINRAVR